MQTLNVVKGKEWGAHIIPEANGKPAENLKTQPKVLDLYMFPFMNIVGYI